MPKNPDFVGTVKALKRACIESGAGQAKMKLENSGVVDGWTIAIIVQAPDFEPEEGDTVL